jgi:Ca2+-transporting ATPase
LDDNFTRIVNSVEEGRGIYENIRKFVNYLLSCNLGEVLIIFMAILFGWPLPMTAIMLLWLNLVTDGLPALALSVDPISKDLMKQKPRRGKSIIDRDMLSHILYISIIITIAMLVVFNWAIHQYVGTPDFLERIQTIVFTGVVLMELIRLQAIRGEYHLGLFSNKYLVFAVFASIILQLLVIYSPINVLFGTVPLNILDWSMILVATGIVMVLDIVGQQVRKTLLQES